MAKTIRSIKADLCEDETLGTCTRDARFLFVGLITRVDDHGRFRASPALVRAKVFPYDDVPSAKVAAWLDELVSRGIVILYEADGQQYGYLRNWTKHQRIDNAAKSELPEPPEPDPAANCGELRRTSAAKDPLTSEPAAGREGIGGDRKGEESLPPQRSAANGQRRGTRLTNPWPLTPELRQIATDSNAGVDVDLEHAKFCDYWHAKAGRDATKLDWVATWRNWCRNARATVSTPAANGSEPTVDRRPREFFVASAEPIDHAAALQSLRMARNGTQTADKPVEEPGQ